MKNMPHWKWKKLIISKAMINIWIMFWLLFMFQTDEHPAISTSTSKYDLPLVEKQKERDGEKILF